MLIDLFSAKYNFSEVIQQLMFAKFKGAVHGNQS